MTSAPLYYSPASRSIQITGITVQFGEPLKHSLLVELSTDGTNASSVRLKRKKRPAGMYPLHKPILLHEGSVLTVQIQEKHSHRRDEILAHVNLFPENIFLARDLDVSDGHTKKFQICLKDPKQQIWLNVVELSSTLQTTSPCDLDLRSQASEENLPATDQAAAPSKPASHTVLQKLREFKANLDRITGAQQLSETMLKFGGAVSKLNPLAQAVLGCVYVFRDQLSTQDQGHDEIVDLAESMARTVNHIQPLRDMTGSNELKKTLDMFHDLMQETANLIETSIGQDTLDFVLAPSAKDRIGDLKLRYSMLEREFDWAVKVHSLIESQNLNELRDRLLEGIRTVDPRAVECIPGTRSTILADIGTKTEDIDGPNVIWIRGAPGSGKSSISLTAKSRLRSQGHLVTYFRFDRLEVSITTPIALWRHVAYDLARRFPSARTQLLQQLQDDRVDLDSCMAVFTSLIEPSLSELAGSTQADRPLVIVIDALDECGGFVGRLSPNRQELLRTITRWSKLPKHFKLLITSREESDITRVLSPISTPIDIPSGNYLLDNPQEKSSIEASEDIRTLLNGRFCMLTERLPLLGQDWPGIKATNDMVHQAAGNFTWATTAANFIDSGLNQQDRLDRILGHAPQSRGMGQLYSLYSIILETSFGTIADDDSEAEALRAVLGTMVCAMRTLSDDEYTKLPNSSPISPTILQSIRDGLTSVIDLEGNLRFVHKSFDDFLLSDECPFKYAVRIDEAQHRLTELCLMTMTEKLRFNMCGLETSCLMNADVPDIESKVTHGIPALLSYSCCFWADHLIRAPFDDWLMDGVKTVVLEKMLYWFEAMSLLKEMNRVSHSLLLVLQWTHMSPDEEFRDFLYDARRFIGAFTQPIAQSAPHVYISALPFAPEHSSVARHFLPTFPQTLVVSSGVPVNWSPSVFTSEHHEHSVTCVAFSPDEKCFVSGSHDGTICICDSNTGNLVSGPIKANSPIVNAFFDPDGQRVWASCSDGRIIGWDIETNEEHLRFQVGEERDVHFVGCHNSDGDHKIVAASRDDGKVKIWNTDTGEQLKELLEVPSGKWWRVASFSPDGCYMALARDGEIAIEIWKLADGSEVRGCRSSHLQPHHVHGQQICALSFSPDSYFVVTGSEDGSILVWDAETGGIIGRRLDTEKGEVSAVAYSHMRSLLVAAFGDYRHPGIIMVWNTATYEIILGPLEGHTSSITTIALSRDGRRVLSASLDYTARMWDLGRNGAWPASRATEGHTSSVECITFSPCGKKLASLGRDMTIRIWDADTNKQVLVLDSSPELFTKMIFFPHGSYLVAYDTNGILPVWNADTGKIAFYLDFGKDRVTFIDFLAFRSADHHLVVSFGNGILRTWSLEGDGSLSTPGPRPTEPVQIIALSPDGLTAVVLDDRKNSRCLYTWSTTTRRSNHFLTSVNNDEDIFGKYSPNGRYLAVIMYDDFWKLRIWKTQTGDLVAGPSTLDGPIHCLEFSPNDCHIAFSYANFDRLCPIWIWDVRTDRVVSRPLTGHTTNVESFAFSPDGEKLVSGSEDGQIRVWDIANLLEQSEISVGFLGVGTHMQDGWVTDVDGKLLFWVPKEQRTGLVWPRTVEMMGGVAARTELTLDKIRYGEQWVECFRG